VAAVFAAEGFFFAAAKTFLGLCETVPEDIVEAGASVDMVVFDGVTSASGMGGFVIAALLPEW